MRILREFSVEVWWIRNLLVFVVFCPLLACSPQPPTNLVLVVVDTVRADHLPLYGYDRDTVPHVGSLAREAVVFDNCLSPIPLTDPAMASLLTGTYPTAHGVRDTGYSMTGQAPTLAEILRTRGYHTAAFFSRVGLATVTGLDRGFDIADDEIVSAAQADGQPWHTREGAERWQRRADRVTDLALDWLSNNKDRPFFLLLHYFDPHAYYDPPEAFRDRFPARETALAAPDLRSWWGPVEKLGSEISRYDEEILAVDHHLDRFLAGLREAGLWDHTIFVLTSDHGESLGEHGIMDHGEWLYQEQLHVPLLIRDPAAPEAGGRRVEQMVRLIDLAPTMLDMLGFDVPPAVPGIVVGQSLAPLLRGETLAVEPIFLETENCPEDSTNLRAIGMDCYPAGILGKRRGVTDGRWKLILTPATGGQWVELYDLLEDPKELQNRSAQEPEIVGRLATMLNTANGVGASGAVDEQLVEQLRALGYSD